MRYFLIILLLFGIGTNFLSAQEQKSAETDSMALFSTALTTFNAIALGTIVDDIGKYKLYPTENTWIFLKLNTQTGQVYQVQFSVGKKANYGEWIVSNRILNYGDPDKSGRFELYRTNNIYNFLLLDKYTGAVYQVQWGMDSIYRGLYKISEYED